MIRTGNTANGTVTVRWDRDVRGSADRYVMRAHAAAVTAMLTGPMGEDGTLVCPLTGEAFLPGDGEVDRTMGDTGGYAPDTVVLTSSNGNQGRAVLQSKGEDVAGVARYVADVAAAAAWLVLPKQSEARATVAAWRTRDGLADVLAGAYGTV